MSFETLKNIIDWNKEQAELHPIDEGKNNEEDTTKAVWHICNHDSDNKILCEPEEEI